MSLNTLEKETAANIMGQLELFASCSPEEIAGLIEGFDSVYFTKNKVVLMEQELSSCLYIIVQGSVSVSKRERNEKKVLATLKAPDFFGEHSMFTESPATALVKAEDDSKFFKLTHKGFLGIAAGFPALKARLLTNLKAISAKRAPIVKLPPES